MKLKIKILAFVATIIFSVSSCPNVTKKIKDWTKIEDPNEVLGKYHFLDQDGIKVYLPEVFKRYSFVEYQNLLDSLTTETQYAYESKRLNSMRSMEGNFYIFFDEESRSTYTINTMPYMPLHKSDAQYLLGMIRVNNEKIARNSSLTHEKITAKYSGSSKTQLFKAIYKIESDEYDVPVYSTFYIVSSSNKTVFINLTTGFNAYFDPYLQKMIL